MNRLMPAARCANFTRQNGVTIGTIFARRETEPAEGTTLVDPGLRAKKGAACASHDANVDHTGVGC